MHFYIFYHESIYHTSRIMDFSIRIFLNYLPGFVIRRRLCRIIFSNNYINFIHARNELHELNMLLKSREHNIKVSGIRKV